jgi:hypothetical protein
MIKTYFWQKLKNKTFANFFFFFFWYLKALFLKHNLKHAKKKKKWQKDTFDKSLILKLLPKKYFFDSKALFFVSQTQSQSCSYSRLQSNITFPLFIL